MSNQAFRKLSDERELEMSMRHSTKGQGAGDHFWQSAFLYQFGFVYVVVKN